LIEGFKKGFSLGSELYYWKSWAETLLKFEYGEKDGLIKKHLTRIIDSALKAEDIKSERTNEELKNLIS